QTMERHALCSRQIRHLLSGPEKREIPLHPPPANPGVTSAGGASPLAEGEIMKATAKLHDLGQSLWLDNITRDLLESGTLARYIAELSVTGLTSNPTIFD